MKMQTSLIAMLIWCSIGTAPDEGQWLPQQFLDQDWNALKARGLQLSKDEFWHPEKGGVLSALFLRIVAAHHEGSAAGDAAKARALQDEAMVFVKAVFSRKNPIPLADLFDSPLFLPLVSVRETAGGEALHAELMQFIRDKAPGLGKYHAGL
jgi:hypothetical protein